MGAPPPKPRGRAAYGRVTRLCVGQSYGFIRLPDRRDIFFHRGDVREGASFNDFSEGDVVEFELLDDRISGPRAIDVRRRKRR